MVCFTNYTLIVPKSGLDDFVQYVLKDIYGFSSYDLWFLTPELYEISGNAIRLKTDPMTEVKYMSVKLVNETDEYYYIEFRWANFRALVNVLPETKVVIGKKYFTNTNVIDHTCHLIKMEVRSVRDDRAFISREVVPVSTYELELLVKQLATDNVIQKFHKVSDRGYICVADEVPIFLISDDNCLCVRAINDIIFDYDDGFCGMNTTKLNEHFKRWKKNGDLSVPVVPVNDLTVN